MSEHKTTRRWQMGDLSPYVEYPGSNEPASQTLAEPANTEEQR
jgi:hypothetical protein